uniref:WD repeat-containing protein 19 n=1 Tax=Timema bartmani TaxID=61472 RepID=A0A7R9I199_9NEOP|nr:unnamed protein product [Timema bartmani]
MLLAFPITGRQLSHLWRFFYRLKLVKQIFKVRFRHSTKGVFPKPNNCIEFGSLRLSPSRCTQEDVMRDYWLAQAKRTLAGSYLPWLIIIDVVTVIRTTHGPVDATEKEDSTDATKLETQLPGDTLFAPTTNANEYFGHTGFRGLVTFFALESDVFNRFLNWAASSNFEVFKLDQPHGLGYVYITWQNGSGSFLATTGNDKVVAIFNRNGKKIEQIGLSGMCTGFGWDADGDLLAIIMNDYHHVVLWDANTGKSKQVDTGLRDTMSCVIWAKRGPILAIGTARGNLTIYNHNTAKRVPILGKHSKRVTCGAWSAENLLALGSEDKTLSISNVEGDTLRVISMRSDPSDIQFSEMKLDERMAGENTVSVLVGRKTLFLYNLHDPDNPVELAFQQRYGAVVTYKWFGDGYILVGFSAGYFVAISTHIKEVGQELFQVKNHKDMLTDIAICDKLGKVASCGDNCVKIHDMSNLSETSSVISLEQENGIEHLSWSKDGQLLALSTRGGSVHVFLSRLPMVHSVYALHLAILTSLTEISIYAYDVDNKALFYLNNFYSSITKNKPALSATAELPVEPSWLSLGPYHCAAGLNNRAWFYELGSTDTVLMLKEREYLGTVTNVKLSAEYASVLHEGKIQLHMIEPANGDNEDKETRLFPDEHTPDIKLTCHALTTDFLIFASDMGHIQYFFIEDWKIISEYKHTVGIRSVHADQSGARLIVVDDKSEGYIYNPVTDELLRIPEFPPNSMGVLWDSLAQDRNVFVVFDNSTIVTYIHAKDSLSGSMIEVVGTTKLPSNQVPLLLSGGQVLLETSSGKLTQLVLSTHEVTSSNIHDSQKDSLEQALAKQLVLRRFGEAWKTCQVLNTKECWSRLAEATLKNLEIELGKSDSYYTSYCSIVSLALYKLRVYRHIGDVGMVWLLQDIQHVEDQKLLNGHVAMFLQDFEKAQEWYLMSSRPVAALDMRRDLLQWDQALQLASKLAPDQMPYIACEYAQQLEFMGSYSEALSHYEQGLLSVREGKPGSMEETHTIQCRAGVARTSIRCGDIRRGVTMAADASSSRTLKKECGDILENMKQLNDAAMLYEKGQYFDKAASTYIRLKNWVKVGELLHNITSSKIHLQYAKAKEADGKYQEAAEAYMTARDFDSVIRVNLDHLNNPEEAVQIVKDTKSTEGAKMVARFFQRLNDYSSAIKFLVLSRCHDEAFQLARQHGQMELYGEILASSLDSEVRPDDFRSLALHFDSERKSLLAGKYYFHAGEYQKALKNLMNVVKANSEDTEAISLAIDVVGAANDDFLANQLIEFLLGESDNIPKDPKFLFRLYMARRQYREAAKTAIIIANEEQINGSYRNAHDVLFGMYQELRRNNIKIPTEMQANLTLLHSYILVRLHVRRGEHLKGARMLIRVANNISKFPSHIVPILTSTVIECSRAGLKSSAFSYAAMLMRPEYRPHIDPKYAKKIEAVVRKPSRGSQEEVEPETPCPYCDSPLPESELNCDQCKTTVPFCLVTVSLVGPSPAAGRHIVKDDLTACPNCDFPAIFSELRIILESEDACPMCSETIPLKSVSLVEDTRTYLHPQGND